MPNDALRVMWAMKLVSDWILARLGPDYTGASTAGEVCGEAASPLIPFPANEAAFEGALSLRRTEKARYLSLQQPG